MGELLQYLPSSSEGLEVTVTATVGERFLEEIIVGYSTARIYNSSVKIHFFGGSPQIFKPGMPFELYLVASFHDGSPLRPSQLRGSQLEVRADVDIRSGRRNLESQTLKASPENGAIWSMHVRCRVHLTILSVKILSFFTIETKLFFSFLLQVDLRKQLGLSENPQRAQQILNDVVSMRFIADFTDGEGHHAHAELLMLAHESPNQRHLKVWTSTEKAKVGEYLVLHVQANFYIESFNYIVMSKGTILLTSDETMQQTIKTFAIPLSPEMAPVATVMVYYVGRYGDVVADSLTFPVNGISRNNFTIHINNKKARTGENVEVRGILGSIIRLKKFIHTRNCFN